MHDRNSTPHGTLWHDKRSRQKTLTKINHTSLLKFITAVCVLESVGASSTRQLSTDTTIPGVRLPCLAGLASPRTSLEEPHLILTLTLLTLTLTAHRSPLTFHPPHPHPRPQPTDNLASD
eukprot:scaffold92128_cov54-Phaeocystis_antarctica.AAC.2